LILILAPNIFFSIGLLDLKYLLVVAVLMNSQAVSNLMLQIFYQANY
jgi:hypothetical protein